MAAAPLPRSFRIAKGRGGCQISVLSAEVVGETVRRLRLKRGWSQDFLADQTGLHRAHMGEIERGESNVTIRLKIIADPLGVRIVD